MVYDISCKTLMGAKPLRIRFDKIDGFIRVYDTTRYLVFFGDEKFCHVVCHARIKVDSYDCLPLENQWFFTVL